MAKNGVYTVKATIAKTTKKDKEYKNVRMSVPNNLVELLGIDEEHKELILIEDAEQKSFRVIRK